MSTASEKMKVSLTKEQLHNLFFNVVTEPISVSTTEDTDLLLETVYNYSSFNNGQGRVHRFETYASKSGDTPGGRRANVELFSKDGEDYTGTVEIISYNPLKFKDK